MVWVIPRSQVPVRAVVPGQWESIGALTAGTTTCTVRGASSHSIVGFPFTGSRYVPRHLNPDESERILPPGLGRRLFQTYHPGKSRPSREPRPLWGSLLSSCGTSENTCCRQFRSTYRQSLFLQVFQARVPRKLPSALAPQVVPGVGAQSQNSFHIRLPRHLPQDITARKVESIRLLQHNHAKDQ